MTWFVLLVTFYTHAVVQKMAGYVKLPIVENYKLSGVVGLCKYGHIIILVYQSPLICVPHPSFILAEWIKKFG